MFFKQLPWIALNPLLTLYILSNKKTGAATEPKAKWKLKQKTTSTGSKMKLLMYLCCIYNNVFHFPQLQLAEY